MRIISTNFTLVHPLMNYDYRKKYLDSEGLLSKNFRPAFITPVPEEMGLANNTPLIIAPTKRGHSVLTICGGLSSFTTNYSGDYVNDWEKCRIYLIERHNDVVNLVRNVAGSIIYSGLVTNIEYDDLSADALTLLKKNIFASSGEKLGKLYSAECKFVQVYDNHYYINVSLKSNYKAEMQKTPERNRVLIKDFMDRSFISFQVD